MRRAIIGVAAAVAMTAAACGGGSSGDSSGNLIDNDLNKAIDDQSSTTVAGNASATTVAAVKEPTTMDEWEKLWADERAAVVKKIKDNKWGLQADGKTVLGPDGFKVDLSACGSGWSNTEGLTDTEFKLGSAAPASGTQATAVNINKAITVILDYYYNKGLFKDVNGKNRKVNHIIKDDGYDPTRTIPIVDELIDSDKVFSLITQGSPSTLKTYDKLNARCVPHMFNSTGHPAWGDPQKHPWTSGMLMAYNIEALLWGKFIDDHMSEFPAGKVTVAALVMNNDFGKVYDQAIKAYFATSPNKDRIEYVTEFNEAQAPTVTDQMTTLASKNPAVFIVMETGTPCTQAITEAAQNGMNQKVKYKFQPSVCKGANFVGKDAVGMNSDGWWIVGGGMRDINSPGEDGNAYTQWARKLLADANYDYKTNGFYGWGLNFGWSHAQVYAIAAQLDGGLNRANVLVAMRTISMTPAGYLWGIKLNMSGNKDAYWVEGSEVAQYDSAKQQWVQKGNIIDLSGKSKTCSWNSSTAACE